MRYANPLPVAMLDTLVRNHNLSITAKYIFEKLSQLDGEILREYNLTSLGGLYDMYRQTVSNSIQRLCNEHLILNTSEGLILSIPTYTGFLGIFQFESQGIYRFVFILPKTKFTYAIDIFEDDIKDKNILHKIKVNKCYYCLANIQFDTYSNIQKDNEGHITFLGRNLKNCYLLEDIGWRYHDNQFLSLKDKE